jgi:uncharacterized protein
MLKQGFGLSLALPFLASSLLFAQTHQPKIIDVHHHYFSEPSYLGKVIAKYQSLDGFVLLITAPKDLATVTQAMKEHPGTIGCLGELQLDDPVAVAMVDRFHNAGCVGLGELTGPLYNYDDRRYWPIYERAEHFHMIVLFHTGIVNRMDPETPSDIGVDRMRSITLDTIARRFPKLTLIGAHLGNPDYAWSAEIARWNPNLYFDLSGSSLIKKDADPTFWKSIFWWSGVVSPHTPAGGPDAFEKLMFASDVFGGDLGELDLQIHRYHKMLDACHVPAQAQENIFSGTIWRILQAQKQ